MFSLILYVLLLSIYCVILFYGNSMGLNVLLYNVPLLIFMVTILLKNKKVKNKYGLLFVIPIIILSISYMLYNSVFTVFNLLIIPVLYLLMYVYTIEPTYKLGELFLNMCRLLFNRFEFTYMKRFINLVSMRCSEILSLKKESKKKIGSLIIIIPVILIVLMLLISADAEFKSMFNFIFKAFDHIEIMPVIYRIILIILHFIVIGGFLNYLLFHYGKEKDSPSKPMKIELFTIKSLLITLNIIYIVFDFIQIRSLFLHHVGDGIVYSEYARSGFFQLMIVSFINFVVLLLSKKTKDVNMIKHLSSVLVFLTFIIICSSFYRMYLYDMAYGYTVLRLLVYATLITETILLIPTVVYIYNSKVKILKHYMIICLVVYSLLNVYSIDKIIAKNNIERFSKTEKLDIEYLVNLSEDNLPELYDFYKNTNDNNIKYDLKRKVCLHRDNYTNKDNIFEYNVGRVKAKEEFKKFECNNK